MLLEHEVGWHEFTLYFQFAKATTIEHIRLESMSSKHTQTNSGEMQLLFDVKPQLQNLKGAFTQFEFKNCIILGNRNDDTTSNCIDSQTDTGWKVPAFEEDQLSHELEMQLRKPETIDGDHLSGITIDLEGTTKKDMKSCIRVSFHQAELKNDFWSFSFLHLPFIVQK